MLEFKLGNNDKEYELKTIRDRTVYTKKADRHLPGLYYLIAWKGYSEEENTWEPSLAVMHLRKMVSTFHKDHPEKPTATSAPLNSVSPMAKPTIQLSTKQKQEQPIECAKECDALEDALSEAIKKRQQKRVRVSMILEPKAGK